MNTGAAILKLTEIFRKNNFLAFCKYYLPHLFPLTFSPLIHKDFADSIERARFNDVFEGFLAPRDTAKTTFFAVAAPIFWISHDRNEKIFITQKTGDVGSVIRQIMFELETNEKLKKDFGEFKPKDKNLKWSYEEGGLIEGADDKKNLTISGCGIRGSSIGKRTTKIIIDDPHDPENVSTFLQREKTIQWIMEAILPTLSPKGSFFGINSTYHEDDFLNRYKKKGIKLTWTTPTGDIVSKEFKIRTYDSIIDEATKKVIWPEKNTYEQLMFRKALMTSEPFNRQYRNQSQSEETASFKRVDLEKLLREDLSYIEVIQDRSEFLAIIQVWDLAVIENAAKAEEKDSDYYNCDTIGITHENKRRLLHNFRERGLKSTKVLAAVNELYQQFSPDLVIVESNQFQRWFADYLLENNNLPIYKSITIGSDKSALKLKSSVLHVAIESGLWEFPYKTERDKAITDIHIRELFYFGKEKHDDTLMTKYILEKTLGNIRQIVAERLMKESGEDISSLDMTSIQVKL